jgi:ABC-type nitrate/sulfonate/bicarbonate transport system substrate-binding protein
MHNIKLALDWTPNINHIGFLIAKDMGFYEDKKIKLEILNPIDDNYQLTPGKKLELDLADFAIAPFETVISLNNKSNKVNAIAVFAILQEDLSCIVSLKTSHINSPRDLDNKTYVSYKARYEDQIVKQMIINDGGKGNVQLVYPEKLGIWNTLLEGKGSATWIFDNWEGVEAESKGVSLMKFKLSNYQIPYGYSPVLLTKKENMLLHNSVYKDFVNATKQGFLFAKNNPTQSINILKNYVTIDDLKKIDLDKSLFISSPYFGDENSCGKMKEEVVFSFLNWLVKHKLEDKMIINQNFYTNNLID